MLVLGIQKDMTFKAVFLTGKNSCKGAKKSLNRNRLLINLSTGGFASVQSMLGQKIWGNVLHRCFIKKMQGHNFTGIILQSFSYFSLRTYTGHAILKGMMLSVLDCLEVFHQLVSIFLPKMLQ